MSPLDSLLHVLVCVWGCKFPRQAGALSKQLVGCPDPFANTQRIKRYDKLLGLNSVRELNPAIQNITQDLDAQLSQVRPSF